MSEATVPELRFPEFGNAIPLVKIANLFEYKNGQGQEARIVEDGKYQLITLNSISIMGKLKDKHHTVNIADWFLEKDDLVMVLSDVAHGNFLGLVDSIPENEQYALNQRMGLLRANKEILIVDFAKFYINSHQKYFKKHGQGSSQQNLSKGDILKFGIKLPCLPEQKKIATFLSAVDEKLTAVEAQLAGWRDYKRGMMQAFFSQALRFKADDGSEFQKWKRKQIGEVLTIGSGKDYKGLCVGEVPVYGTGGLMTFVDEFLYDGESVGIGRKGTIDKPVYLTGKFWTVDTLFYTHSFEGVLPKFVYAIFQRINWQKYNEASGVPSLSKNTIEKIDIKIPSLPEQQKIADALSAIDAKIEAVTSRLEAIQEFKRGLLQKMFV